MRSRSMTASLPQSASSISMPIEAISNEIVMIALAHVVASCIRRDDNLRVAQVGCGVLN